ncbi:hypothetical protein VZT92_010899 [Zoarces viviparus]|uniref:Fibronectin type-III domain-containing protein n=1 Tax=Zoarces viviparus TaxID=48416 RepID=A0AAW1FAD1_ZOAVI
MALAASRTLLALIVTFCAPGCGWAAEKPLRSQNGKQTSVDKGLRERWEPSIHLDGRPVDRFVISSNKPTRSHRFTKGKDSRSHLLEDVDPEWVNLDGFAVLGGAPVRNSSAGQARSPQTAARNQLPLQRATRVNRTARPLGVSNTRKHRRAPQSSSGPRQPERALPGAPPLERRRQHHTKPQSDQRNRNTPKLTSESVHVVSLQAQKAPGRSAAANRAVATKRTTPEPPEYVAQDIGVRVMSPQSVLITWLDPAVEMGKVGPGVIRSYTIRYREKGESARWEYKDSHQRRLMIDTLSADGMYEFSVRISQGENQGKWSVSVFQRTPESAPSGPPENFEVKPLRGKGTAVIATWDPPEEPNGRIREYILSYAPAMKPFGMKSVTYRSSSSTATVDGLTPGDRYIFKIRATNRRGQGPQSKILSVVMPGSSSTASSFSKTKDSRRTIHTPSKQDTDHDEPDLQSRKVTEEPTTPPPPRSGLPVNRRVRPLSPSRSYHNILSSVRGSVRNTVNRGSSRGRAQDREDEEKEEEKIYTTASPVEETTTMEVVPETKEPENNVSPEFEDEAGYDEGPLTTERPSLKVSTPSPIKPRPNPLPRRPIKIRVHQKPGSKAASSSSSNSSSSSSSGTSPVSSSSFDPSLSSTSSSRVQESAASKKDYVASSYPESKDTSDKPSTTHTKPSSTVVKETNSQQTEATSIGRGSVSAGRTKGGQGGRPRYPIVRGKPTNGGQLKPANGNGKNGRPNLTATHDKDPSSSRGTSKAVGQKFITGPDGSKWVVDLEQGVLMNQDGQVLQDSQGRPKRVVLGEDGRTIFDHMGSPLLNQEGMALFGHGRESLPVVNPKDKVLMVGGKPVLGLDLPHLRTTTTRAPTTTTTRAPTTTPEPTTTDWIIEESTTALPFPTCPPGTFSKTDEYGYPALDAEGTLDCYPEEESSGMEMDYMPDALVLKKDDLFVQTTLPPTTTTTTTEIPTPEPDTRPSKHGPSSELDLSGKKRFTAPYVNYIQKDPASPCSLTEALEYLQVDVLEGLMEKDSLAANQNQPPKNKPHNLTVVAMEGCHSFIILDWGRPLRDDMVSGYLVHSASYDDVLNNRWSTKPSSGTHLALENLKPNSRYYFKVQAKNVFGLGPVSDTLTYVTESDDPLLIERPPGGEPIWIPFTFKYNSAHSSCKGSQYVKRTWYRKFVGVVLCNSLRYKIFMGDSLREPFYSIGDTFGHGDDHCQFVDSYRDGRTGPEYLSNHLPSAQGFYRAYRQQPVSFGVIGRRTPHPFVGWYECGVPIPGKW